jgi:DNA-binding CsgD family transcriptional regulator
MPLKPFSYSFIYNDIEKAERYWKRFKLADETIKPDLEKLQILIPFFEQISSQNSVCILIYNTLIGRYIYTVDNRNVIGYETSLYLAETGVDFVISIMHRNYLTSGLLMNQKAFEYAFPNKDEEGNKMIVSFDGMCKKSNGEYIHFLQQPVCIQYDGNGYGVLLLNYVQDITCLKKEGTANLVIRTNNKVESWNFNFNTNTLEPVQPLSRQEKKVLSYLEKGKSSKEMASELFTSSHTIDTHRRNLLKKTNCLNTTGLVTYAKLVGLL